MSETVSIHGKTYVTIASRNADFRTREAYKGYSSHTEILEADENKVVIKATIQDSEGKVISTGHAEEFRTASKINQTSCMENCETSALGRCLAFLHPDLAGTEIASADEVAQAIGQQNEKAIYQRAQEHMAAVRENIDSIREIKSAIYDSQPTGTIQGQFEFEDESEISIAIEAWSELDTDTMKDLWLAPTKGGIFTTQERAIMKSDRWGALSRESK